MARTRCFVSRCIDSGVLFRWRRARGLAVLKTWREGQQHVAWNAVLESDISRADKHHAFGDARTAGSDRSALGRDVVHGLEFLSGVELPQEPAILGGDGA